MFYLFANSRTAAQTISDRMRVLKFLHHPKLYEVCGHAHQCADICQNLCCLHILVPVRCILWLLTTIATTMSHGHTILPSPKNSLRLLCSTKQRKNQRGGILQMLQDAVVYVFSRLQLHHLQLVGSKIETKVIERHWKIGSKLANNSHRVIYI